MATVTGIDVAGKAVVLGDGAREPFDQLIVAVGSRYGYFGHDDWAEHSLSLKMLPDALAVVGRLRAVATFGRVRLEGTLAWLAWALIHLGLLIDFRSRILVYVDWIWGWLHGNRADRLILRPGAWDHTPDRKQGAAEVDDTGFDARPL